MVKSPPSVTVVIPYEEGRPIGKPPEGDETIWMDSTLGIGEQRVKGVLNASHEWIVQADADGYYPDDYIEQVKGAIASGKYPHGFWCQREGRLWGTHGEAGLVVRRNLFLERTKNFVPNHLTDVSSLFRDLPVNREITYRHPLSGSERSILLTVGTIGLGLALSYASMIRK